MDYEESLRDSIDGIPSGGVSGPKATVSGDSIPSGKTPATAGAAPSNNATSKVKAPAPSKFASQRPIPQISVKPVKQPDDHKHDEKCAAGPGDQVVTAEFCLENFARVMREMAENQEDPTWTQAHQALADQWMQMAQILLQYRINAQANIGEAELKQQQMNHEEDLHQQTMAQNDQQHAQNLKHAEMMHSSAMKQKDDIHKQGLDQKDQQHKFKMDTAAQNAKAKSDVK